jgi:hypothetical protein
MKKSMFTLTLLTLTLLICCPLLGSVSPISAQTESSSALVSHFDVELVYAYAAGDESYAAMAILNFTRTPNQTLPVDGVADLYTLELYSDGEKIASNVVGCTIGAQPSMDYLMALSMSTGHCSLTNDGDSSQSRLTTWSLPYNPMNPTFVEPLTLKLIKTGWIVVDGNATWSKLNLHEKVAEVYLAPYQGGYLYNNLVPQDQLADPKHPPTPAPASPSLSNPTATPESVASNELIPTSTTMLVAIVIVALVAACTALLLHLNRRRFRPSQASLGDSTAPRDSPAPHQ